MHSALGAHRFGRSNVRPVAVSGFERLFFRQVAAPETGALLAHLKRTSGLRATFIDAPIAKYFNSLTS
jgi:hypothetical protein